MISSITMEAVAVAQTKEQKLAKIKECQDKCDAIMLRPPKAEGAKIRAAAAEAGETVTKYILDAVRARMERECK